MIFVIDNLKYNTDNMDLVSEKCEYAYDFNCRGRGVYFGRNVKLWKSKKNNWLITFEKCLGRTYARALSAEEAKQKLMIYDVEAYEREFGELEEA